MPKKRHQPRKPVSLQSSRGAANRTPPSDQLTRLEPHLRTWLTSDPDLDSADDAESVIILLEGLVELAEQAVDLTDLYSWTPDQVSDLLDTLDEVEEREAEKAGDDPDKAPIPTAMFASALAALLGFIEEIGRWRGSAEQYREVEEILSAASGAGDEEVQALEEIAGALRDDDALAASAAAVDAMPLTRSLLDVLAWLRPSQALEDDALSPRAVTEAAALLGVTAEDPPGAADEDGSGSGSDEAALVVAQALDALVGAGLVEAGAGVLAPTAAAQQLLGDPREHRASLEVALTLFLGGLLWPAETGDPSDLADPTSVEAVEPGEVGVTALIGALLDGETTLEDVASAEEVAVGQRLVEDLRRYGYLVAGETVLVTPGLEQLVAEGVLMVIDPEDDEEGGDQEADEEAGDDMAPGEEPATGPSGRV